MKKIENMHECEKWLYQTLSDGIACPTKHISELAKKQGFKKSQLKEARKTLGVKTIHQPVLESAGIDEELWLWVL